MRVLVISNSSPYPVNFGGAQRIRAIIATIADRHDVVFAGPLEAGQRVEAERALRTMVSDFIWIEPLKARPCKMPQTGSRLSRLATYLRDFARHTTPYRFRRQFPVWQAAIAAEVERADAIICRHAEVYPLVARRWRKTVLDLDDLSFVMQWQQIVTGTYGFGAIMYALEALRTAFSEQWFAWRCARVLVASKEDGKRLLTRRKSLVENGVTIEEGVSIRREAARVIFVGHCGYDPNTEGLEWFVRDVWPTVRSARPDARFAIVGRDATLDVVPFADAPDIELADNVPSVGPWFASAALSVVPLFRGGGTRIKILESLGYGTPVVSTPVGALGLTSQFGANEGLVVAASPRDMAAAILQAINSSAPAQAAAQCGQRIVQDRYSWGTTTACLADELEQWVPTLLPTLAREA